MNATFAEIGEAIAQHQKFLILSHMRPDGDALGCELAMTLALRKLGKDVTTWNEDGLLEKLRFLPGSEAVTKPSAEPEDFDVVLVLDTAVKERVGTPLASVGKAKLWINIDHHHSNLAYGDLSYIDSIAPATGQILFELFTALGWDIDAAMAENLFVAISTDTGSFQYPSTTARTYEIGAELIKRGADVGRISRDLYDSYPLRRVQLLRSLLNELTFSSDNRVASFALTEAAAQAIGVIPEDNEGLIDHIRAVEGVIIAIFFEELPEGRIRISVRSKDPKISASAICQHFGGGGHILAAGARIRGTLNDVRQQVLDYTDHEIRSRA
ncbi:MAG TPA: bifunctional oligoribonuclease/PAP phosphatase NrnA [Chthoniobacterales bacterium]